MELVLAGPLGAAEDAAAAGAVPEWVDRLDGVKMLALAALALVVDGALGVARVLPAWLRRLGVVLGVALVVSAAGYGCSCPRSPGRRSHRCRCC